MSVFTEVLSKGSGEFEIDVTAAHNFVRTRKESRSIEMNERTDRARNERELMWSNIRLELLKFRDGDWGEDISDSRIFSEAVLFSCFFV